MLSFLKFSKQANLANTYCKSKFKESLLFISPAVYLCFSFNNTDVALVILIVTHTSDQLVGFFQYQSPGMVAVEYCIDDLQTFFFGIFPLHQTFSGDEMTGSGFQS